VARLFEPAAFDIAGAARVVDAQPVVARFAPVECVGICGGVGCLRDFFVVTPSLCCSLRS
jgi:hypothetical protein